MVREAGVSARRNSRRSCFAGSGRPALCALHTSHTSFGVRGTFRLESCRDFCMLTLGSRRIACRHGKEERNKRQVGCLLCFVPYCVFFLLSGGPKTWSSKKNRPPGGKYGEIMMKIAKLILPLRGALVAEPYGSASVHRRRRCS